MPLAQAQAQAQAQPSTTAQRELDLPATTAAAQGTHSPGQDASPGITTADLLGQTPQVSTKMPASMTQSQRDALIVEVLGDVGQLSQQVSRLSEQVQAAGQLLNVQEYAHWQKLLDAKLSELASINLSQHASARLQSHAQAYLGALAKQVDDMVTAKVQERVAQTYTFQRLFDRLHRDWLMRLGCVAASAFLGTLLALATWRLL